jgi:hypothetical protein
MTDIWRRRFDTLRHFLLREVKLSAALTDDLAKGTLLPFGHWAPL